MKGGETVGSADVPCPGDACPATVSVTLSETGAIELSTSCNCYRDAEHRGEGDKYLASLEERARPVAEEMF